METTFTPKNFNDKELIKQHKELLDKFMKNELEWESKRRKKLLEAYDNKIFESNIRFYFCRPFRLFITAFLLNKLDTIANYFPKGYEFNIERIKQ